MHRTQQSLSFNCAYARVAVYELSAQCREGKLNRRSAIDKELRAYKFQKLFDLPSFHRPREFWNDRDKRRMCKFNLLCDHVLNCIGKRWKPDVSARKAYLEYFSIQNWKALPDLDKNQHTLSECLACAREYLDFQKTFPSTPIYEPLVLPQASNPFQTPNTNQGSPGESGERIEVLVSVPISSSDTAATLGPKVMTALNTSFSSKFNGDNFESAVTPIIVAKKGLMKRPTPAQKKKEQTKIEQSFSKNMEKKIKERAATIHMSEKESDASYERKRRDLALEKSDIPRPEKRRITDKFIEEQKDNVEKAINNLPIDKQINWTDLGRQLGLKEKNCGQKIKDLVIEVGIDLGGRCGGASIAKSKRNRRQKCKVPGSEVPMPAWPTIVEIKEDTSEKLSKGELTLREPCCPFNVAKVNIVNGSLERVSSEVYGRKIPLLELRKRLLKKHEEYMRLDSDTDISSMSLEEVKTKLQDIGECIENEIDPYEALKNAQRCRSLVFWHDHSTILKSGYLLVTVHVLYDPAVYYSTEEYERVKGKKCEHSVQQIVEEPEIYMFCLSSSSLSDQLRTIADRLDCLYDFEETITSTNGIPITDKVHFFIGDHPAQSFERGTQVGGHYKCGSCGCKSNRYDDFAHAFSNKWRSLSALQATVLKGKHGNQSNALKPFSNLTKPQLVEELRARGVFDLTGYADQLKYELQCILRGAQRVPTLLVTNPSQSLSSIHLEHYTVLDCEPLHDLKGHLANLFEELPYLLNGKTKTDIQVILDKNLKKEGGCSGSDLRVTLMQVRDVLQSLTVPEEVKLLIVTAVQISDCLYSSSANRTPKKILQLYNSCWLHHELCKSLFSSPKKISYEKMFGIYLHSLVVHAPVQFEIVSLRSVNTENQERLFQQAKQIASICTNRKQGDVIPKVILRIQTSQNSGRISNMYHSAKSRVQNATQGLPEFQGTHIKKTFLDARLHSWQCHLQRISMFLAPSEAWWKELDNAYVFFDGDSDDDMRIEGPVLSHFRSSSIETVLERSIATWQKVIK